MIQNHNEETGEKEISNPKADINSSSLSSSLPSNAESQSPSPNPSLASTSDLHEIRYSKILVPHDNTQMSDKALGHAIYLANATGAEIIILFVMEKIEDMSDSSLEASMNKIEEQAITDKNQVGKKQDLKSGPLKNENEDSEMNVTVSAHGQAKKMIVEKLNFCKSAGAKGQVSYRLMTGRSVEEEIVDLVKGGDADLIVMTSSTISSSIRSIGSTARKVIDNVDIPVLIIHR
jgi:nucleotide-binding universal stress UspA family protein